MAALDGTGRTGSLIWESGSWSPSTGALSRDPQLKIYEVQQGIWDFNGTGACDVESAATGHHLFHFVKNNCVALDNRIPPLGFTGADDIDIQPVGYTYPETAPGSGVLVNYDDVSYKVAVPLGTPSPVTIEATLRYQTASDEYIEFLRHEAVDNDFPDDCIVGSGAQALGLSRGEYLYALWNDPSYGRSPPVDMATDSGSAVGHRRDLRRRLRERRYKRLELVGSLRRAETPSIARFECVTDDGSGFRLDPLQVLPAEKALSVDLVDLLGPGGTSGEPAVFCHDLEAADWSVVARRVAENRLDGLAGQLVSRDLIR